jgi:phospholipid transport system substrate-binding protein
MNTMKVSPEHDQIVRRWVVRVLIILAVLALFFVAGTSAQSVPPDQLVKSVATEILDIVKADAGIRAGNRKRILDLVHAKVLPHFDFARMTALATGIHWRKATPTQREALTTQFRDLLVNIYASSLSSYRDQKLVYHPLRVAAGDPEVVVKSEIRQSGKAPITIDYSMTNGANGWKVYDIAIDGLSLVTTYRESFGEEIRQHGIDGLIGALVEKNGKLATQD